VLLSVSIKSAPLLVFCEPIVKKMLAIMSNLTYIKPMSNNDKPLVWLHGEVKSPPFSQAARLEAGFLLRKLQRGEVVTMPHARPMPFVGLRCYELRINDANITWRIMYRIDPDAIIILAIFDKKTARTPKQIIDICQNRIRSYDSL
jgi:phage-related protein